ncbi:hypothetical protein HFP72_29085 [Nocardiopsis sp. ARC36]
MQTTPVPSSPLPRTVHGSPGILWGLWPALAGMALLGSSVAVIGATAGLPAFGLQSARYAVAALTVAALARLLGKRLVLPGAATSSGSPEAPSRAWSASTSPW